MAEEGAVGGLVSGFPNKKVEDKHRKKDPKSWDNVSKSLANVAEADQLPFLGEKYKDLYHEFRRVMQGNQQLMKQTGAIEKERDHNHAELAKSVVARARLENLCRELQKQNKQIKEENIAKIKEEEERRKEVSMKFADKLNDINNMMDENKEKSDKLRDENLRMTAKLAELYSQFQKREEDISKMSQQLDLERQYSQATLKKMELEIQAEKEMHSREQALMKSNLEKSEANCCVLLETVKGLQDHIDVYKNQYEDFENTMSKSAKVFDNFKFEIASMTKQVNALEQEAQSWKNKFYDSMKALVEMSELKKNQDIYAQSLDRKNEQLNKLCRQLQIDRSHYLKLLKSHGIEPSGNTLFKETLDDEPKPAPKITKKEKELLLLKDNLKAVQEELSRLNVEETTKTDDQKGEDSAQSVEEPVKDTAERTMPDGKSDQEVTPVPDTVQEPTVDEQVPTIDSQDPQSDEATTVTKD